MADDSKTLELQIRIAAQEAVRAVSSLKGEIQNLASEAKKFEGTDGKALERSFKDAQAAAKDSAASIGDIKKAVLNLAEVAAAAKALSFIKDMGAFALQTADNFQTAKNQFGVLLGDMEAGAGLFNEIKAFNDVTPFDLDTLTQATNVLIAAKVPLNDLQNQLTKFGDLSQGNSQRMTSYVNAFSQAAAKGKADMQVLNTYLHQGVPILDALAKNFNTTTDEIVEMSSEGKISFEAFSKALDDLTAEGGQYFGGMELASQSLAAMQEGLKEAVNSLAASFGEMLVPVAKDVTGLFTDLTNAINESPIAKGVLAAAVTAVTGVLGIMAVKAAALTVKTWLAYAAQMGFNASLAVTNPYLWAGIAAVAAATAGYVYYASTQQKAAKETERQALEQKRLNEAIEEGHRLVQEFYKSSKNFDLSATLYHLEDLRKKIEKLGSSEDIKNYRSTVQRFIELRKKFTEDFYDATPEQKVKDLTQRIEDAKSLMKDLKLPGINIDIDYKENYKLQQIIDDAQKEINKINAEIELKSADWKQTLQDVMNFSDDEIVSGVFKTGAGAVEAYSERLEEAKKHALSFSGVLDDEASVLQDTAGQWEKLLRVMAESGNWKATDKLIEDVTKKLNEAKAAAGQAGAAKTIEELNKKIEDFGKSEGQLAYEAALANGALEDQAETIGLLTDKLNQMQEDGNSAIKDWQQELSDNLKLLLKDIGDFSDQSTGLIGDMAAQLTAMSFEGLINGLTEVGKAFATGEDAGENFAQAMSEMARQMLNQLPMMFLQAGLQLIAQGQWPLGLGFVAAAGSSAIIAGYVEGKTQEASKNAQGGVFDEYAHAARTFAAGGAFTNQIVSSPTYFAHGGGLGLMGEAGPEAIMPLTRMPNGDLGVQTGGSGANVIVNIINNSGAEVRQEESDDGNGGRQIDVIIGEMVNKHIASGKADRAMGRYGLRAAGV